jgi:hypothetical protein
VVRVSYLLRVARAMAAYRSETVYTRASPPSGLTGGQGFASITVRANGPDSTGQGTGCARAGVQVTT